MYAQQIRRVAVIGAGPCGLASAKCLLEEGIEAVVFEQSDDIGGVWLYKDVPDLSNPQTLHASCYKSLTTNSSRDMTTFSDFPFPFKTSTNCPTHQEILRYLREYASAFDVLPHIRFNTKVMKVERDNDRWLVTTRDLLSDSAFSVEPFDGVMVCTGMFWDPVIPRFQGEHFFKGLRFHSHYYRTPDLFAGKKVLLIGIGNSALDISMDLAPICAQVTISCRSGTIMLPLDDREGKAADQEILSRSRQKLSQQERAKLFGAFAKDLTATFIKHGMPFPPKIPEQSHYSILKKPDRYVEHLKSGRIRIAREVAEIKQDQTVIFKSAKDQQQKEEKYDAIIYCTGYSMHFPFFKEDPSLVPVGSDTKMLELYKRVMHPQYPTLCYISQIDTIGSLFNVGEMQARWVSKVWAGHAALPSVEERQAGVKALRERVLRDKPRYPHFINFLSYMDDLAHSIDCHPYLEENKEVNDNVKRLLDEGPLLPITFRLNGYKKWAGALEKVARL